MSWQIALFFAAGIVGGVVNAAAGGAKLFVFPMLLATGLPPLAANVTQGVALWPAQLPAAWVYRQQLLAEARRLLLQMVPALVGSLSGALVMVNSNDRIFVAVVPVLLLLAVVSIVLGPRSADLLRRAFPGDRLSAALGVILFFIGFYGGFFGAGMGFMLLAVLSAAHAKGLGQVNGAKNLFAFCIQSVAVLPMALSGLVDWTAAAWVCGGGLLGGYLGAIVTRRLPDPALRIGVAALGVVLTATFLLR